MHLARFPKNNSRKPAYAYEPRALSSNSEAVICVHGYLSHGAGMYLIKRRLEREYGMRVLLFSYPSVQGALDENARALAAFIARHNLRKAHIVGHSLGGVLALRMHANDAGLLPGRIVCLGSPLTGSRAADCLHALHWAEDIVGNSVPEAMVHQSANDWADEVLMQRDVGVIAGTVSLGLGRLFANFDEANDGTITVSETRLAGIKDHLVMRVSHKGLLVSANVADQAAAFIRRGEFLRS